MKRLLGLLFAMASSTWGLQAEPQQGVKEHIPEVEVAGQLVLVVTESWDPGPASLRAYERRDGGWARVGEEIRASIGRNGLAWGIGLHGSHPEGGSVKKEGDGKSPAGVFAFDELFGSLGPDAAGITRFAYRQMSESFAGVDDPKSRYYNRIVDSTAVAKDWTSAENMVPAGDVYRLGAVVRHNWQPFPGYGSCIFLHTWEGENKPTSGCTAMVRADLERVLRWLDQKKRPVLVQLPAAEYERRKRPWKLP